jgi:hypothetical protein
MSRASLGIVLLVSLAAGGLGPRLSTPGDKPAGAPFEYVPPDGFLLQPKGSAAAILGADAVDKTWIFPTVLGYTPNVTLTQTAKAAVSDPAELDALAQGMPSTFSSSGISWTEVRHEIRSRPDGARVAVITGDCEKGSLRYRTMQMVFPNDAGSAIVTASYPLDGASRWEKPFEDSISNAKGVAVRRPSPPAWLHFAWAAGAGVLAYLALALRGRSPRAAEGPARKPGDEA